MKTEQDFQRMEHALTQTIGQRDNAEMWADRLADAIATHFGADIGEPSNINNPWAEALEVIGSADAPAATEESSVAQPAPDHVVDANKMVYLSGPMTGLPELNFPAFHAAARRLRALGWQVVNPAEINTDPAATWHQCLRNDLIALAGCCDVLALMPGWQTSRGAHLELHVARELGLRIVTVEELEDIHA